MKKWRTWLGPQTACIALGILTACGNAAEKPMEQDATLEASVQDSALDASVAHDVGFDSNIPDAASQAARSALYPQDWTPNHSMGERFLHDFSYAGYRNGEEPPTVSASVFNVVNAGAANDGSSDATAAIQGAIDQASQAGGIVLFPAGTYRIDGLLRVRASRVVLRGESPETTRLYFTKTEGMAFEAHLSFDGNLQTVREVPLRVDGANRSHLVLLSESVDLLPGQDVSIGISISEAFVAEHGMTGTWQAFNGQWMPFFRRQIASSSPDSEGTRVVLDVPLRYPQKTRDLAKLRVEAGYIEECGLENLSLSNAVSSLDVAFAQNQVNLVRFTHAKDCWVRNIRSFAAPNAADGKHIWSNGIRVGESKRITIDNVTLENAQHRGSGGNGYLFEIQRSGEILTRDSTARNGRHNFIQNWGFGTSGCVWLRILSIGSGQQDRGWPFAIGALSEYHHSLAVANLVDQSQLDDGWVCGNRGRESSGAGHTCSQTVLWNISGSGTIRSYNFGEGYVIGTAPGITVNTVAGSFELTNGEGAQPEDYREFIGQGSSLSPSSLYEDQRRKRLSR